MTGNSLAYLLCQEQKRATADVRMVSNRGPDIRKSSLVVATLILMTGFGVWAALSSHAQVEAAALADLIDPSQITMNARDLPTTEFIDYTFHFPSRNN
jgi:hypothetical protein